MLPFIIGIAGGTASGKTTLAMLLKKASSPGSAEILYLDSYYLPQNHLSTEERAKLNFDHPSIFEFDLLLEDLKKLKKSIPIESPQYDFALHTRKEKGIKISAALIIIFEGILAFHDPRVRELLDYKVFVETPSDIRFARRLERDVKERGRTEESVRWQWNTTVQPMHDEFCETSKIYADEVVSAIEDFEPKFIQSILARAA